MTERPVLFSAPMVRAVLAGTKTQTRRAIRPQPSEEAVRLYNGRIVVHDMECSETGGWLGFGFEDEYKRWRCPYAQAAGDRLWVRETWAQNEDQLSETTVDRSYRYRADGEQRALDNGGEKPWRPSIHMPRRASRITLEVTGVRVERLQDISEADAIAEGLERTAAGTLWRTFSPTWARARAAQPDVVDGGHDDPRHAYRTLWESINGAGSWDASPWVWVISFAKL